MLIDSVVQAPKSTSITEDPYLVSVEATYPARPFRLFDLPRELRDTIYDYALVDHAIFKLETKSGPLGNEIADRDLTPRPEDALDEGAEAPAVLLPSLQASIRSRAATNLLLADKAMKQEYEERVRQAMIVVLKDNDRYAFQPVTLPEQAKKAQNLELHLILFCHLCPTVPHLDEKTCHAALELEQHRTWIDKLLPEMKELRSLAIHTYICYDKYKPDSKQKLPCERIIAPKFDGFKLLPKVKKLTLSRYDFSAHPDLDGPKVIVSEWPAGNHTKTEHVPERQPEETEQMEEVTK